MGCVTSRPAVNDASDAVLKKCKQRMFLMQNAIRHREEFAEAHIRYVESLAKVGIVLKKLAEGEDTCVVVSPPRDISHTVPESHQDALSAAEAADSSSVSCVSPLPSDTSKFAIATNNHRILQKDSFAASSSISPHLSPSIVPPLPTSESSSPQEPDLIHYVISPLRRTESLPAKFDLDVSTSDDAYSDDFEDPDQLPGLLTDSSWFSSGNFTPPGIPEHLKEQRRLKQFDENGSIAHMEDRDGMPNLDNEGMAVSGEITFEEQEDREKGLMTGKEMIAVEFERRIQDEGDLDKNIEESMGEQVKPEARIHEDGPIRENIIDVTTDPELNDIQSFMGRNLPQIMEHIGILFERASKCGQDLSSMLEMQSHQHVKILTDSLRTFNAITSHWSHKASIMIQEVDLDNEISGCGMAGSHVSTLERLYVWETKLYDEGSELILKEFNQKCKQLHVLEANNASNCAETRVKVKKLDARLTVALKAIQVTSAKIQDLTNDQLFPQLCELLEGSIKMWKMMQECHSVQQYIISSQLHKLQHSFEDVAIDESSDIHKKTSADLRHELEVWRKSFLGWMSAQKKYVNDICSWLKECYENGESNRSAMTNEMERLPIFLMMTKWEKSISNLEANEKVSESISKFIAAFPTLERNILNEVKFKEQVDQINKSLDKQSLRLEKLERKHTEEIPNSRTDSSFKSKLKKVRTHVDKFKNELGNHESEHSKSVQERKKSMLGLLKDQLPPLFQSLFLFAEDASNMYQEIRLKPEMRYNSDEQTD